MNQLRVKPRSKVDLSEWDTRDTAPYDGDKESAAAEHDRLNARLEELQELLYAEARHKLLVVLQGMDTSGKGGTIRHVFEGVNPAGVRVASFKAPTSEELSRDFLWRIHRHVPARGEIVIFDRSHYEDVLIVRVHELVPKEVWSKRYDQINDFERMLSESGTTILKFFLHISEDEQKERLQKRLDDPKKNWKFRKGDLDERKLWRAYQRAYEDVLAKTSTKWAPWYVIPADRKWFRNLAISRVIVDTLESFDMKYPTPEEDVSGLVID